MHNWRGDESWKNKEMKQDLKFRRVPGKRQSVVIIIEKTLLGTPGLYKHFRVNLSIPMKKAEIDERMRMAFPELMWRET